MTDIEKRLDEIIAQISERNRKAAEEEIKAKPIFQMLTKMMDNSASSELAASIKRINNKLAEIEKRPRKYTVVSKKRRYWGGGGKSAYEYAKDFGYAGSEYEFSQALANSGGVSLGETSTTAYPGDKGKTAYNHSQSAHAPADANNYVHPANHPPSIITQDASNRFVTDAEKSAWNGKQDALGFTPVDTTDSRLSNARPPTFHYHNETDINNLEEHLAGKQASLVSGTNIKTVGGNSLLGSGNIPFPSAGAITRYNAKASGDTSIAVANTWYTGAGISLPAGTYLVTAQITVLRSTTTALTYAARISDGTNHYASAGDYRASAANNVVTLNMNTIITLAGTTTINVQATASQTATIKAALASNGAGNNATQISAIQLQ